MKKICFPGYCVLVYSKTRETKINGLKRVFGRKAGWATEALKTSAMDIFMATPTGLKLALQQTNRCGGVDEGLGRRGGGDDPTAQAAALLVT